MPSPTESPRVRVVIIRQLAGKYDDQDENGRKKENGSSRASRTASFTVHGVESEEWLMNTFLAYIRYLQTNGYPDLEIKQNQTARNATKS